MGSHPEVKSHKALRLCRCLVHSRSTSEHFVQMTLDVGSGHLFHNAAEKGSMALTGTAGTKIGATIFEVSRPQQHSERMPMHSTPIYPDKSTGLLLNGTNGISLPYVFASPFLPFTSSPSPT